MKGFYAVSGAVLLVVLVLVLAPFTIIPAGHRGVVLTWGAVEQKVLGEGLNWRTPLAQHVIKMDVRIQKEETNAAAATKDLQTVSSKVALNFYLDPMKVATIYQTVGVNYMDTLISPVLQESIKAASARYTAEELVTKRELVREDIKALVVEKLSSHGIVVDGFNIVDFDFSQQFNAAIEAKVTAEQSALAAQNKLKQVEYEADQRVEQARAEAEAIKIQAEAIMSQGGENYVNLKAIEKWNGVLPAQFVPGSALPFVTLK